MNAIQLTLDQTLYRVSKDEIKEEKVCDLVSFEDGKMRVMILSDKSIYIISKTDTNIQKQLFFTRQEAEDYQLKLRTSFVKRALSKMIRSAENYVKIAEKYKR